MKVTITKYIWSLLFLFFCSQNAFTQSNQTADIVSSGLWLSAKAGSSMLVTEIPADFSKTINEFSNRPGLAYGFELSKYIAKRLEVGGQVIFSGLSGKNNSPAFSAIGFHHAMLDPINQPVLYQSNLISQKIVFRYYLHDLFGWKVKFALAPYVNAGIGNLTYKSELRYNSSENNELIFGKRTGEFKNSRVSTAVYFLGPGLKTSIAPGIDLIAYLNINLVNYDFLDVVHNYNPAGEREEILGIYSEFMIGFSVGPSRWITGLKTSGSRVKKSSTGQNYMPWYNREK